MVVLGCPHFSFAEFEQLAEIIQSEKSLSIHPGVRFIVISNQVAYSLLQRSDLMDTLIDFGVQITLDTCLFHTPLLSTDEKVMMTNSGKCAYYAPGELGVQVAFGSMADCVRSAVKGYVYWEATSWTKS